jgi:hypothetical protein
MMDLPDELLRNRAAALLHGPGLQVDPCGPCEADNVHPCVAEEEAIFSRENGRDHRAREAIQWDIGAILARTESTRLLCRS